MNMTVAPETISNAEPASMPVQKKRWPAWRRIAVAGVAVAAVWGMAALAGPAWIALSPDISTTNAYIRGDLTFVATKVSGYVQEMKVENNNLVAPGQMLVRIDPRDFEAAVRDQEAVVAQQKAAGAQIEAQTRLQQSQIQVADAAVQSALALNAKSAADYARAARLVEEGAISKSTLEASTAADLQARAALAQSQAQSRYARDQLGVLAAQLEANHASVLSAEAKLLKARNDFEATTILAPREGLVTGRNVRVGEYVAIGTRLLAVSPTKALWVEANLLETQISRIRSGDRVSISVDAIPGRVFCGTVDGVAGASGSEFSLIPPDNATGNFTKIVRRFPVRILIDGNQPDIDRLAIGMSAEPKIFPGSASSSAPDACRR